MSKRISRPPEVYAAVDTVLFALRDGRLEVLLIRRDDPARPPLGWALPGRLMRGTESSREAALLALREKASVENVYIEQLYTFTRADRDSRGRVITIAYYALVPADSITEGPGTRWVDARALPTGRRAGDDGVPLLFDHARIIKYALRRLENKLWYTAVALKLVPREFTLTELQRVYEAILGRKMDPSLFRQRILATDFVIATGRSRIKGRGRPAQVFRRNDRKIAELEALAPEDAD